MTNIKLVDVSAPECHL